MIVAVGVVVVFAKEVAVGRRRDGEGNTEFWVYVGACGREDVELEGGSNLVRVVE